MVQTSSDPNFPQHGPEIGDEASNTSEAGEGSWMMSREEHAMRMRELNLKRGIVKAPRRGWSMTECQGDSNTPRVPHTTLVPQPEHRQAPIPEHVAVSYTSSTTSITTPASQSDTYVLPKDRPEEQLQQLPQRPKIPTPRRSYSVMDFEPPAPNQPRPSTNLNFLDLPSELHYLLCDYLDPIDSVCLGLTHSKLYTIHRRKHGSVPIPLSSRYSGPNDMEWAWRGAGPLVRPPPSTAETSGSELGNMRVKGQVYCRKCGISRCELHRHLRGWMGDGWEYCEIREVFGRPAGEGAKKYCFMSSPRNPERCGRHGGKKKKKTAATKE